MKTYVIGTYSLILMVISSAIQGAASSSAVSCSAAKSLDISSLVYFYRGSEHKALLCYAEENAPGKENTLIFKAGFISAFKETPMQIGTLANYEGSLAHHRLETTSEIVLINNKLIVVQPHCLLNTHASLFVKNQSAENSLQPHEPPRRFILLGSSQSKDIFNAMTHRLNHLPFSWTAKDIAEEFIRTYGQEYAFALVDLTSYLQMYRGPDWQKTLPVLRYRDSLYSQDDIECSERFLLQVKAGVIGTALGAVGLATAFVMIKRHSKK